MCMAGPAVTHAVAVHLYAAALPILPHDAAHSCPPPLWTNVQVCDTVSELGAELSDDAAPGGTQWPELLPAMFQLVQSGQPGLMESGLTVFGNLAGVMAESLKPSLPGLIEALGACLGHASREVQLAALRATAYFIQVPAWGLRGAAWGRWKGSTGVPEAVRGTGRDHRLGCHSPWVCVCV